MNVILVGRHVSDLPADITIVAQENITWSVDKQECLEQLRALVARAYEAKAAILFQNIPGILAAALMFDQGTSVQCGVIISVPGPRLAQVSRKWLSLPIVAPLSRRDGHKSLSRSTLFLLSFSRISNGSEHDN